MADIDTYPAVLNDEEEDKEKYPYPPVAAPLPRESTIPSPYPNVLVPPPAMPVPESPNRASLVRSVPNWSSYAPPEPHGAAKFGHFLASLQENANQMFNVRPQKQAATAYEAAVSEQGKDFMQQLDLQKEERAQENERRLERRTEAQNVKDERLKAAPTIQVGDRTMQWNPDTNRYDIEAGAAKPTKGPNTKEEIQSEINDELAKPKPDQKLVKSLQDRLRAIDPLADERLRDAEQRLHDAERNKEEGKKEFHPAIAQQVVQSIATQTSTRRLLDILKEAKDDNVPFSHFIQTLEYRLGKAQADAIGQELASINLTSLQQAGSVLKTMGGVRAARVLEKVMQHTPDPLHDSTKNMYDKLLNIDRAIATFLDDADKYGRKSAAELPAASLRPYGEAAAAPKAGTVEDGYRFKGGDPKDKKNWEKVKPNAKR